MCVCVHVKTIHVIFMSEYPEIVHNPLKAAYEPISYPRS